MDVIFLEKGGTPIKIGTAETQEQATRRRYDYAQQLQRQRGEESTYKNQQALYETQMMEYNAQQAEYERKKKEYDAAVAAQEAEKARYEHAKELAYRLKYTGSNPKELRRKELASIEVAHDGSLRRLVNQIEEGFQQGWKILEQPVGAAAVEKEGMVTYTYDTSKWASPSQPQVVTTKVELKPSIIEHPTALSILTYEKGGALGYASEKFSEFTEKKILEEGEKPFFGAYGPIGLFNPFVLTANVEKGIVKKQQKLAEQETRTQEVLLSELSKTETKRMNTQLQRELDERIKAGTLVTSEEQEYFIKRRGEELTKEAEARIEINYQDYLSKSGKIYEQKFKEANPQGLIQKSIDLIAGIPSGVAKIPAAFIGLPTMIGEMQTAPQATLAGIKESFLTRPGKMIGETIGQVVATELLIGAPLRGRAELAKVAKAKKMAAETKVSIGGEIARNIRAAPKNEFGITMIENAKFGNVKIVAYGEKVSPTAGLIQTQLPVQLTLDSSEFIRLYGKDTGVGIGNVKILQTPRIPERINPLARAIMNKPKNFLVNYDESISINEGGATIGYDIKTFKRVSSKNKYAVAIKEPYRVVAKLNRQEFIKVGATTKEIAELKAGLYEPKGIKGQQLNILIGGKSPKNLKTYISGEYKPMFATIESTSKNLATKRVSIGKTMMERKFFSREQNFGKISIGKGELNIGKLKTRQVTPTINERWNFVSSSEAATARKGLSNIKKTPLWKHRLSKKPMLENVKAAMGKGAQNLLHPIKKRAIPRQQKSLTGVPYGINKDVLDKMARASLEQYYAGNMLGGELSYGVDVGALTPTGRNAVQQISPQAQITRQRLISRQQIIPRQQSISKQQLLPKQSAITKQFIAPISSAIPRQAVIPQQAVISKQQIIPRQQLVPRQQINPISLNVNITAPHPPIPPPIMPGLFMSGKGISRAKKIRAEAARPYRYTPTFAGFISGKTIRKPARKVYTGLEIRYPLGRGRIKRRAFRI